jgi:hypothetical protein
LDFIPFFDRVNLELQSEQPMIHKQAAQIKELIKQVITMFVKPSAMIYKDIESIDFRTGYNIKTDEEIMIGQAARSFLQECKFSQGKADTFFTSIKSFFTTACNYLIKRGNISEPHLKNAVVADVTKRPFISFAMLDFFVKRYPAIMPAGASLDQLQMQLSLYQIEELPPGMLEPNSSAAMDQTWMKISEIALVKQILDFLPK